MRANWRSGSPRLSACCRPSAPAPAFPPPADALRLALKGAATEEEIEEAIQSLSRRSVVVFRRHTGSYALGKAATWTSTTGLQAARQSVERDQNLAAFLTRQVPPQPLIARRHYFQTGTLRYFETLLCRPRRTCRPTFPGRALPPISATRTAGSSTACPATPTTGRPCGALSSPATDVPVVVALPQDVFDLRELCHELVCLRWVVEHTPELEV